MGMTPTAIIIGKGGHAKVVCEAAREMWALMPFGISVEMRELFVGDPLPEGPMVCILGFGDLSARRGMVERLLKVTWMSVIHPLSRVLVREWPDEHGDLRVVGRGTFVAAGATVGVDARVGPHCIINTNAAVDHDCVLGENVHVAPGAVLCGGVKVGRDVLIGANATVLPNLTIGDGAVIGAGVTIRYDVAAGEVCRVSH